MDFEKLFGMMKEEDDKEVFSYDDDNNVKT